jgi:hypothetical protein
MSTMTPLPYRLLRLNLGGLLLGALCAPVTPAWATCADASTTRTCIPGGTPDAPRNHTAPGTTTLLLQGPAQFGVPLFLEDGLDFQNPGPASLLTLTSTGRVEAYEAGNVVARRFMQVLNFDGVNSAIFSGPIVGGTFYGARIDLSDLNAGNDATFGFFNYSGGNSSFPGNSAFAQSLTQFEGTLILNNVTLAGTGLQTEIGSTSAGEARTVIGPNGIIEARGGSGTRGVRSFGASAASSASLLLAQGSSVTVVGARAQGIVAEVAGGSGNALIDSLGSVDVTGADGTYARFGAVAYSFGGNATVNVGGAINVQPGAGSAPLSPPETVAVEAFADSAGGSALVSLGAAARITASGSRVFGVRARTSGAGSASVLGVAGSVIDIDGDLATGVLAQADGDVTVTTADVLLEGNGVTAINATSADGAVTIDTTAALTETRGRDSYGIRATAATGLSIVTGDVFARGTTAAGLVTATDSIGIFGTANGPGNLTLDTTAGIVATRGNGTRGIILSTLDGVTDVTTGDVSVWGTDTIGLELFATDGSVAVDTRGGGIEARGNDAQGIRLNATRASSVFELGDIGTTGERSDAVRLLSETGSVTVRAEGAISTVGSESAGIAVRSTPGAGASAAVDLEILGSVATPGLHSSALLAQSSFADVAVDVATGASVFGGWENTLGSVGTFSGTGGTGVLLGSGGIATFNNSGAVGAGSDRALALLPGSTGVAVANVGTMTGYATFGAGVDSVANSGAFDLRHYADTNGDGTRDTKRVAEMAFGAGDDVFRNDASGALRLLSVPGAPTVVTDFQYLPDLMPVAGFATTTAGVEQAHLVNLERFEHRGLITLRDADAGGLAPVAGDVLLMTSGSLSAAGVLTPGASPMVFLSDGGTLALDTELNQGGAASHSDMLVVDSIQLGGNGATRVFITNAGGMGAPTTGSGIKLVDVLGGNSLSAANAFVLGAPVVAGAFTYNLFQSGPLSADGDWYLRTAPAVNPPEPPVTPPVTPPTEPEPPVEPPVTYRPEAALFAAMPGFLRNIDAAIPGSRAARLGDEADGLATARRGRVWARYISEDIETTQTGTVSPAVDGEVKGYQFGVELFGGKDEAAAQIGLYAGRVEATAAVSGFANGIAGAPVGRLEPEVTYAGVYVSRSRGRGLYFDTVLQYGFYAGEALTYADGEVAKIKGTGGYASLELGYGLAISPSIVIEPQVQVLAQPQRVHEMTIVNAQVRQDPANTVAGRGGLRVKGDFGRGAWRFQPYIGASLWKGLDHSDRTRFSGNGSTQTTLDTASELNALEFVGGLSLGMGSRLTAVAQYAKLSARGDAGMARDGTAISAGLRFAW